MTKESHGWIIKAGRITGGKPVTMDQVRKDFAKIMAPILMERTRQDEEEKRLEMLSRSEKSSERLNEKARDRAIYQFAKAFLLNLKVPGVTKQLINKYSAPPVANTELLPLSEIYKRILESAQNANMKAGVIGRSIGGVDKLAPVLNGFDPSFVVKTYSFWEEIFEKIKHEIRPIGKMRDTSRSIWPQFCRSIQSAAKFVDQFSTSEDFYDWVKLFDGDNRARVALPMLLASEIEGIGFALACDFLKEIGFVNFAKPDVHIRDIFKGLGLCSQKATDYEIFKAVIGMAANAGVTPYNADKLFWLIGSGYFYDDPSIGNNGRIGSYKEEFIRLAQHRFRILNEQK